MSVGDHVQRIISEAEPDPRAIRCSQMEIQTSDACARVADRVLDGLLAAVTFAEKRGLPPEAVLAAALETVVNLLEFERGIGTTATLLEQLASRLRKREMVDFGWALAQLNQHPRKQRSSQPSRD